MSIAPGKTGQWPFTRGSRGPQRKRRRRSNDERTMTNDERRMKFQAPNLRSAHENEPFLMRFGNSDFIRHSSFVLRHLSPLCACLLGVSAASNPTIPERPEKLTFPPLVYNP